MTADECLQLLGDGSEGSVKSRAKAVKGLVELALGDLKSGTFPSFLPFFEIPNRLLPSHKEVMG